MSKTSRQNFFYLAIIGALAFLAVLPMICSGLWGGNDLPQHYQFAETFYRSILSGDFYPSWADAPNQGYGDIGIRFYPPLAYYVLSAARMLSGDWFNASLLTFFLIFWASGAGAYFWAKENFSSAQSLLAAGIYVFAPYHLNQIYNNFLFAEFAVSAILPFCFLFVSRVCRKQNRGDVLGLSISFALLLLTHLPTSIFGSLALAIYAVALLEKKSFLTVLPKLAASVFWAAAASSFYWLRMLTEMSWVNSSLETNFQGHFDYRENFLLFPFHLLNFQDDVSSLWLGELMILAMIFISIPSAILLMKKRFSSKSFFAVAIIFVMSVLMATPVSRPIWDFLPFLQKVQFPWRWLGIVSLSGAIFSSCGIFYLAEIMNRRKNYFVAFGSSLVLIFFAFVSSFIIKQANYISHPDFNAQIKNIESANSFDCWWTVWAKPEALATKDKVAVENRTAKITGWNPTEKEFEISAGESSFARVAIFYYPRWKADINGESATVEKTGDGAISIRLPQAESRVRLYFDEPFYVKTATAISVFAWLSLAFAGAILAARKKF